MHPFTFVFSFVFTYFLTYRAQNRHSPSRSTFCLSRLYRFINRSILDSLLACTHTLKPHSFPFFSFGTQTNAFARFAITHRLFTLESISLSLSLPSFLSSHFPFVLSFSSLRSHLFFFSFCRVSQERIYMCLKIVNN